ncbi:MAG: serine hydrolase domain-containing protein [Gemmatimonadaceae bacterium]
MSTLMTQPVTTTTGNSAIMNGHLLTANDRFLAGSAGKTFFAALALRLAGTGTLSLDAPVVRYLPDAAIPAFAWITPRMLLSHLSGIGEYDGAFMTSLIKEPLRPREQGDWLNVIRRNPPVRVDAGKFRYSDLNYVALAMVRDTVTPSGAYAAINTAFLQPLGLTATVPSTAPRIAGLVTGYDGSGSMFGRDAMMENGSLVYNPQFEYGGGGFASTPRDLRSGISGAMQVNTSDTAQLLDDGFTWLDSLERRAADRVLACPASRRGRVAQP